MKWYNKRDDSDVSDWEADKYINREVILIKQFGQTLENDYEEKRLIEIKFECMIWTKSF